MPLVRRPSGPVAPGPQTAVEVLEALASAKTEERWAAARAAAAIPGGVPALRQALSREEDQSVREAILTSLARISTAESVEAVIPLLRSDDANLRTGALDALRVMADTAKPYLSDLLADADADVRILACEIVRSLPGDQITALLCLLLESEQEPNVCASALDVLADVAGPDAIPFLLACGERFRTAPFLAYSIKTVVDRIRSQSSLSLD